MKSSDPPAKVEVIARGLVIQEGCVLLCRDVGCGHAYLPGGHVEPGESAAGALAREFKEEAGLEIRVGPPLLVWEARFVQQGRLRHEWTAVFHVEHDLIVPSEVRSLESKITFEWVSRRDVLIAGCEPRVVAEWIAQEPVDSGGVRWLSIDESD